jgi:hypothetical protein
MAWLGIESGCLFLEDSNYCLNYGTTYYLLLHCKKAFECDCSIALVVEFAVCVAAPFE